MILPSLHLLGIFVQELLELIYIFYCFVCENLALIRDMASPSERSSSSRSTNSLMPGRIVVAFDATKNLNAQEFDLIFSNIQSRRNMIQEVDTITVLGVLHKVLHPSKSMIYLWFCECLMKFLL